MILNNIQGEDPVLIGDDTSGRRIGQRIKEIRIARGLSQQQLGEMVGLNGPRIQNYESGTRKPKVELLVAIAQALGVEASALADPIVSSYIGAMYGLFEMEKQFALQPEIDEDGRCVLVVDDGKTGELNEYLRLWVEAIKACEDQLSNAKTKEERKSILQNYKDWKWSFPRSVVEKLKMKMMERKKVKIQEEIDKLQKQLVEISETNS